MKVLKTLIILSPFLFIFTLLSCGKVKKTDAELERENWITGFSDSIEYYQDRAAKIEDLLHNINLEISGMLENFEVIKNPREVEGYYLLKGWKTKLPLTSTGIYARISEKEKLELIATLAGSTFNQIAVGKGDTEFYSDVVPNDQAFNFRHERFNTVYFSSGKVDTIAEYISQHHNDKVNLQFLEGKIKKNFVIPDNEKEMIRQTWVLFNSQKEARKLQKELWISSKKIETFRRIMDAENKTSEENHN